MKKNKILFLLLLTCTFFINAQQDNSLEKKLDLIGQKIDSTLANLDKDYINSLYDVKELSDRFLLKSENKKIKNFNKEFYKGLSSGFDFGNIILTQLEGGASYDYLRYVKDEKDNYYLLFRLYGEGLNYHKHLIKMINNEIKIVDSYIYLTGDYLSESFNSIYKGVLLKGGFLSKLSKSKNNKSMSDLLIIQKMKKLKLEGKFQEAHELYKTISAEGKKKKIYKISNLMIVAQLEEPKYLEAIRDYEKDFPGDISLYIVSIDGFIMNKKYDEAIKAIDNLDKAIGGDSFLNYLRGNAYYLKSNYNKSEDNFLKVTEDYPQFMDAFDSLLTIYIETNKTKKAIEILNYMVNDFELPKELLFKTLKDNFPEFHKKEEVINWSKQ